MKRHNKEKRKRMENVPEIFKVLWDLNFVEEINMTKVKNEILPKIRLTVACKDENKIKMIKALVQKYEFPFGNLKIVQRDDKKERDPKEKPETNAKPAAAGNKPKLFKISGSNFKFKVI